MGLDRTIRDADTSFPAAIVANVAVVAVYTHTKQLVVELKILTGWYMFEFNVTQTCWPIGFELCVCVCALFVLSCIEKHFFLPFKCAGGQISTTLHNVNIKRVLPSRCQVFFLDHTCSSYSFCSLFFRYGTKHFHLHLARQINLQYKNHQILAPIDSAQSNRALTYRSDTARSYRRLITVVCL